MSEIVNLRRARKDKAREEREKHATENRVRFGVPKKERKLTKARSEYDERNHGAHRLDLDKPLEK